MPTPFAVLFPGQGSQHVGMGADVLTGAPEVAGAASAVLGYDLVEVCLEGPEERLTETDVAQPALYVVSHLLWRAFSSSLVDAPDGMAGHSLGEYTALAAAGAMTFEDGLRLVAARGVAMAQAAAKEDTGMAALIGGDAGEIEAGLAERRSEGGQIWSANHNAPGQLVAAGSRADIDWLTEHAAELGARRAIPLAVAGAFHTPFMEPAAEDLAEAIADTRLTAPEVPVWSNVTAQPHGGEPSRLLIEQLTAPVRFAETLANLAATGIDTFVHVGPGDVTAGLVRRTLDQPTVLIVNDLESAGEAAEHLKQ